VPHESGEGADEVELRSEGTSAREKNQIETPSLASWVAQTPPPAAAKAAPYELARGSRIVQPELSLALAKQLPYVRVPEKLSLVPFETVQPSAVCMAYCRRKSVRSPSG